MSTNVDLVLLEDIDTVEDFLKSYLKVSSSKLKKYFARSFLSRSFKKGSTLSLPLNFVNDGLINPRYVGPDISLVYEDEFFLVLDKPANIFVHPLSYEEQDNCLSFLRSNRPELLQTNEAHYDRGLLYRLDYETSGVLVYLKPPHNILEFRENFHHLVKEKKYRCWVQGKCDLTGEFTHYFEAIETKGRRIKVFDNDQKKSLQGILVLKPLSFDSALDRSLMEVTLLSGLRHQIRAQMAHLGYPLCGDHFYGAKVDRRLFLHACHYKILWKGKEFQFSSQHPEFN